MESEWVLRAANFLYSTAIEEEKLDMIKEGIAEEKAAKAQMADLQRQQFGSGLTGVTAAGPGNNWGAPAGVYSGTPAADITFGTEGHTFSEVEGDTDTPDITPADAEAEAIVALEADVAVTEEDND